MRLSTCLWVGLFVAIGFSPAVAGTLQDARALLGQGRIDRLEGNYESAAARFQEVLAGEPGDAVEIEALYYLGKKGTSMISTCQGEKEVSQGFLSLKR
jgi:hypothetical protein